MKPTLESVSDAMGLADKLHFCTHSARLRLAMAGAFLEATSPRKAIQELKAARLQLVNLRRSQMAALRHIDEAIKTAEL